MNKTNLALLLGATGAILGLKALYKAYKLDYELSEGCDNEDSEDADDEYIDVYVHRIEVPIHERKQDDVKAEDDTKNETSAEDDKTTEDADKGEENKTCKERITEWRHANPEGHQADCAEALGISKTTVNNYWKVCESDKK